jgi:serine protease Do
MRNQLIRMSVCVLAGASVAAAGLADREKRMSPVVQAYRTARPAVVNISTTKIVSARLGLFGDDRFNDIFPSPLVRRVPVQSLGSGVVIHPDGYIITNAHVVQLAQEIRITGTDNTKYTARIISADPVRDLAVLKIDPAGGRRLPHLRLGRSDDLMVGETVVAIGNPMGLANTVTTGVISATDRTLEFDAKVKFEGLIQTDAPINPGNSGGPLLNVCGELIGINTAIRPNAQNIGFAIPVDAIASELAGLLDFERINRVVFGASVAQRRAADPEVQAELHVTAVRKGTPAAGKLEVGDRIVVLNGLPMKQIPEYACAMLSAKAGDKVRLVIQRGGEPKTIVVPVAAKPRPDGKALGQKLFGMTVRAITPELAADLRLPVRTGLLVVALDEGSPAERIGLRLKDVVFQVDRFYVKDLDGLGLILEDIRAGQAIRIGVVRGNVRAWVHIRAWKGPPPAPKKRNAK